MTTTYDTKEQALEMGAAYVGYRDIESIRKALAEAEVEEQEIGNPLCALLPPEEASKLIKKIKVHTIKNPEGKRVSLGIGKFREGFDLWLINPKIGAAIRT